MIIVINFIGCVQTLFRVLVSVNKFISRSWSSLPERWRSKSSLRACQARETFSRPAGMRAGGRASNHMARRTCHMRIPDTLKLRPYIKRNEACTTGTPAPAIARWRCNELIILARQSCEYKRCSRIHVSASPSWANVLNFEIFPIICDFLSFLSLAKKHEMQRQRFSDFEFNLFWYRASSTHAILLVAFTVIANHSNHNERVSYLWDLT